MCTYDVYVETRVCEGEVLRGEIAQCDCETDGLRDVSVNRDDGLGAGGGKAFVRMCHHGTVMIEPVTIISSTPTTISPRIVFALINGRLAPRGYKIFWEH